MGAFSIWHWLIIFFAIGIPAALVGAILWWAMRMSKKSSTPPATVESRLEELFRLRSKGLISLAEYEQQRVAILENI
jgi:predicted MFS family arabinose efflux permease